MSSVAASNFEYLPASCLVYEVGNEFAAETIRQITIAAPLWVSSWRVPLVNPLRKKPIATNHGSPRDHTGISVERPAQSVPRN